MDNLQIADAFSFLSKLMEIHGENSFKAKSFAVAAYTIEKLPINLTALPDEKIFNIKGIGNTIGKVILEIKQNGRFNTLEEYLKKTPPGVVEMLQIKGLGPKKIAVIWKEMGLETIGEVLYACNENRLLLYKGFGEKTQQNVKANIEFYLRSQGSYLYAGIESYALRLQEQLQTKFPGYKFELSGAFARQLETIDKLEWVTTASIADLEQCFLGDSFKIVKKDETNISFKTEDNLNLTFFIAGNENFGSQLFQNCCSADFYKEWEQRFSPPVNFSSEDQIFKSAGVPFIPPYRREKKSVIDQFINNASKPLIQPNDVKAIIHSHSNWSDGRQTIEEMAKTAMNKGFEYLVISDHSKSAFYANGLKEDRIIEQHQYIDDLNRQLHPFKIFKSIEADILNDGSLDYHNHILATFDLVIASIHSNLKMAKEKAMMRLLTAIQNPYTTILGHMTGRLLLIREGYPVDHKAIIDACAEHDVVIELNAHPQRLDIDWRWIDYAIEKEVLISINPDAHHTDGYNDIRYGILVAQKAGLSPHQNLSSFSLQKFELFLQKRKEKKNI